MLSRILPTFFAPKVFAKDSCCREVFATTMAKNSMSQEVASGYAIGPDSGLWIRKRGCWSWERLARSDPILRPFCLLVPVTRGFTWSTGHLAPAAQLCCGSRFRILGPRVGF